MDNKNKAELLEDKYIDLQFKRLKKLYKLNKIKKDNDELSKYEEKEKPELVKKTRNEINAIKSECVRVFEELIETHNTTPRIIQLVEKYGLNSFERDVLLTLACNEFEDRPFGIVGIMFPTDIISMFENSYRESKRYRRAFEKGSTLIEEQLVELGGTGDKNLSSRTINISKDVFNDILGLKGESLVDSEKVYRPNETLNEVALADKIIQQSVLAVHEFLIGKEHERSSEQKNQKNRSRGLTLLFYGPPGTGKTLLAHAIANKFDKDLRLVNYATLGMDAEKTLNSIFRQARIHDAIILFDDCEQIFGQKDPVLLNKLINYEGIIILALNEEKVIGSAMRSRIDEIIEFEKPDHRLRKKIWEIHLPADIKLSDDINLEKLSKKYNLSGRLIQKAVHSARLKAIARDNKNPQITGKDLDTCAEHQLITHLKKLNLNMLSVPSVNLKSLVLSEKKKKKLQEVLALAKFEQTLFDDWGFSNINFSHEGRGVKILLAGPPGTGKTLTAHALAGELDMPLFKVRPSAIISKYVGKTSKNLEALFEEANRAGAVILFDEADSLFANRTDVQNSTDREANTSVGVLLQLIEAYTGPVFLTTNLEKNIDQAFSRRLITIKFNIPNKNMRLELWKNMLPEKTPRDENINWEYLANEFPFTGGDIKNVMLNAATQALMRSKPHQEVTFSDLLQAATEEKKHLPGKNSVGFATNK